MGSNLLKGCQLEGVPLLSFQLFAARHPGLKNLASSGPVALKKLVTLRSQNKHWFQAERRSNCRGANDIGAVGSIVRNDEVVGSIPTSSTNPLN
jgi:hypothetical protein